MLTLQTRAQRVRLRRRAGAALARARGQLPAGPRGPQAVLASLVRGLDRLEEAYALDPPGYADARVVGVLSDLDALAEAITWRRADAGRRLIAGPNLAILPSDAPELMTAPEIDVCLVPSDWVRELYEADAPALRGRIAVWPAGVDEQAWRPGERAGRRAIVYRKDLPGQHNAPAALVDGAARALAAAGFGVTELDYGTMTHEAYRAALGEAEVMVFFSASESQCLAQVEAWACDVPTLVWDGGRLVYRGREYATSSGPYVSAANGRLFADAGELEALLAGWDELRPALAPREWVLEHMTDVTAATAYRDLTTLAPC